MIDEADRAAFLRTIVDEPNSDTPRLVFADWLDENGDPHRAEFIRVQCSISERGHDPKELTAAWKREEQLRAQHLVEWRNELPQFPGILWEGMERGFFSGLLVSSPEVFFEHHEELFAAAPISRLRLHRFFSDDARRLAELPGLSRVRFLDLEDGNGIGNAGLDALARSPGVGELYELKLRSNRIGSAGVYSLANSPHLKQLKILWLDRNDLFDGIRALVRQPTRFQLEVLRISRTRIGGAVDPSFFASENFRHLHYLDLDGNDLDDEAIVSLAESPVLRSLWALYLNANHISDEGAIALANSPVLRELQLLYLRSNRIGDTGAQAFADSPHVDELHELILAENRISGVGGDVLRKRFGRRVWLT